MLSKPVNKWVIKDHLKSRSLRLYHRFRHQHQKPCSETFLPVSRSDTCDETIGSIVKERSRVYSHKDGANCYFEVPSPKDRVVWIVPTSEDDTGVVDDADVGEVDDVECESDDGHEICNTDPLFAQDELNFENKSTEEAPNQMEDKEPDDPVRPELLYEVPPSCPRLTEFMIQVNKSALAKDPWDLIHTSAKYKLEQRDLATLDGEEWLNDQIVNFYLELIRKRSLESGVPPKVYYFYATFFTILNSPHGLEKTKDAAHPDNIFENDLILFPVCVSRHWLLVAANVPEKTLTVYNSMPTSTYQDKKICEKILQYLKCEYGRLGEEEDKMDTEEGFQESEWSKRRRIGPKQNNGHDCGVFLLQFAEYLSRSQNFDFGQDHMPYFRQRIMFECITGKLLN